MRNSHREYIYEVLNKKWTKGHKYNAIELFLFSPQGGQNLNSVSFSSLAPKNDKQIKRKASPHNWTSFWILRILHFLILSKTGHCDFWLTADTLLINCTHADFSFFATLHPLAYNPNSLMGGSCKKHNFGTLY